MQAGFTRHVGHVLKRDEDGQVQILVRDGDMVAAARTQGKQLHAGC